MSDHSKMLERVRALLAKAESTNYPEEAETFRQKADDLMTRYSIDLFQVQMAQEGVVGRPAPEKRTFEFSWWYESPFSDQLWGLYSRVAVHCRCIVVSQKLERRAIPVVGMSQDLDYFDMLFTNLMLQMAQKIDPQPRAGLDLNENLALMREAGMPWKEAIPRLINSGLFDDEIGPRGLEPHFDSVYKPWVHGYRRWCRKTGHEQSYVNQNTFRRNFASGFVDEVGSRLRTLRREQEATYDEEHESGSMDIAIRDIRTVVQEALWEFFPDLKPHPKDCDCATCEYIRKQRLKPVRYRSVAGPKIDHAAREAGRAAGRQADIANPAGKRMGQRKRLG